MSTDASRTVGVRVDSYLTQISDFVLVESNDSSATGCGKTSNA